MSYGSGPFFSFSTTMRNATVKATREGYNGTLLEYKLEPHNIPTSHLEAAVAVRPDTVLGAAACTVIGSSCVDSVSVTGGASSVIDGFRNQIPPTSISCTPDSDHAFAGSPSCGSSSGSDCFDLILHEQGSGFQKLFPVILDGESEEGPGSPAAGTFWERQQAAMIEALKPDGSGSPAGCLQLGLQGGDAGIAVSDADCESGLASIISLDFDEAEFPQLESL